ncbi:MAG: flagellar FlbD family protein [Clostridiales Family XIII bacterium]|jgi:flagellar protein FlbD|nr:flagellar FlbD family protein [Clostridiales Family XIII bacterium]
MIKLTRLNKNRKETFMLNCDLIETVEELPDTTIKLLNGNRYVVEDSVSEVISKVIAFKRSIYSR